MNEKYEFDAFISYSHRDSSWAVWLQNKLENWQIPTDMQKDADGRKHLVVFRDQTDLAGVELQESIQKELRKSRYLIVLCSPSSAKSPWVAAEIAYFKQLGRQDKIIPFIVEGEPETNGSKLECYSGELRNVPNWHFMGANTQELGKQKAFLKVVSILLDIRFNRLVDRDRQKRIRRLSIIGTIAAVFILVISLLIYRNVRTENEKRMLMYGTAITSYAQNSDITPEMIEMLIQSAEAGESQSCLLLGDFYQNGQGVEENPKEAFNWYSKAAKLGNSDGIVAVANSYANGMGTEKDMEKAFSLYVQAADMGNTSGMFGEGICYRDGEGTEKNEKKAFELFRQAAEEGHSLSTMAVAYCYLSGIGTEVDQQQAFTWVEKLAQSGDPTGMYNLALMYQMGYGTQESPEKAFQWYRNAAEAGDADGMYMVGWCLENGYGNPDQALDWYIRSMDAGNETAAIEVERILGSQNK